MSLCKIFWAWIVLTLTAAWLPGPATAAPTASDRVNILFIAIDDLNDWVGFLRGHPQAKTPNMDRLAARGKVFANAHCAAPLCCPSRAQCSAVVNPSTPAFTETATIFPESRRSWCYCRRK